MLARLDEGSRGSPIPSGRGCKPRQAPELLLEIADERAHLSRYVACRCIHRVHLDWRHRVAREHWLEPAASYLLMDQGLGQPSNAHPSQNRVANRVPIVRAVNTGELHPHFAVRTLVAPFRRRGVVECDARVCGQILRPARGPVAAKVSRCRDGQPSGAAQLASDQGVVRIGPKRMATSMPSSIRSTKRSLRVKSITSSGCCFWNAQASGAI